MLIDVVIRHPGTYEYDAVQGWLRASLKRPLVRELFAPSPVPLNFDDDDWSLAWAAFSDTKIVGVLLTNKEWVTDLWVLRESRGWGWRTIARAR
jgi:hypothetical protein